MVDRDDLGRDDLLERARRVVACYDDLPGLTMALVTGSVARGLADGSSDLDIHLYWSQVDRSALEASVRAEAVGASRVVGVERATGYLEKLQFDDRFVDVESVGVVLLEVSAEALDSGGATDQTLGLACSLRDAVALAGADQLERWQRRLVYGDELARHQVLTRGVRLLSPRALFRLTVERGDTLSYERRVSGVLIDVLGLLGAVNQAFLPLAEPKWLPWHVERLAVCPPDLWARVDAGLLRPDPATAADLHALAEEVLDLVDIHVAGADTAPARFVLSLDPTAVPGRTGEADD